MNPAKKKFCSRLKIKVSSQFRARRPFFLYRFITHGEFSFLWLFIWISQQPLLTTVYKLRTYTTSWNTFRVSFFNYKNRNELTSTVWLFCGVQKNTTCFSLEGICSHFSSIPQMSSIPRLKVLIYHKRWPLNLNLSLPSVCKTAVTNRDAKLTLPGPA